MAVSSAEAHADPVLPTGGQVVAGQAQIGLPSGGSLVVDQQSQRAVIDWQSFSIGAGGTVQFNNGSGATLNRVTGGEPSAIAGLLRATGSLYLINPAGVVVDGSGQVLTGGSFVASTRGLSNDAFMAGGDLSFVGSGSGSVRNAGRIEASGDAVLIGNWVETNGTIKAGGTAGVVAGETIVLREAGGDARIAVSGASGDVTNSGGIEAMSAELRAAGGNLYALAGTSGLVRATGTVARGGRIWLTAGRDISVAEGAVLDASATTSTGSGGVVHVVTTGGRLDFRGMARARAGAEGGDGGFIDTSGHQGIDIDHAKIDLTAPAGNTGEWLIDPYNLTVTTLATQTITNSLNAGTNVTLVTTSRAPNLAPQSNTPVESNGEGDIITLAPISWTSTARLTLSAYRSISIGGAITAPLGTLSVTTNTGGLGATFEQNGHTISVANFLASGEGTSSAVNTPPPVTLPGSGTVVAGTASIGTPTSNSLTITQTSQRAVIDWGSFSIGQGGTVQFNNGTGATLNRVTGGAATLLAGTLNATGSVYIVNPAGILVQPSGRVVTTGAFVISTRGILTSAFMAGGDLVFSGTTNADPDADIAKVDGQVTASDVFLFSNASGNVGTITATGQVGIGSGTSMTLREFTTGLGRIVVSGASREVYNNGSITGPGSVEMRSAGGRVDLNGGTITSSSTTFLAAGGANADIRLDSRVVGGTLRISTSGGQIARSPASQTVQGINILRIDTTVGGGAGASATIINDRALTIDGINVGSATMTLATAAGVQVDQNGSSAAITAGTLALASDSVFALNRADNAVGTLTTSTTLRSLSFSNAAGLTLNSITAGTIDIRTTATLAINSASSLTATGTGDALVLQTSGLFSSSGNAGLSAPNGRFLVFVTDPSKLAIANGLTAKTFYGRSAAAYNAGGAGSGVIATGNRFVFASSPTATVTPGNRTVEYDRQAQGITNFTITRGGTEDSAGGFSRFDDQAEIVTGFASQTQTNVRRDAGNAVIAHDIQATSLTSGIGAPLVSGTGQLTITPRALTINILSETKTYGDPDPTLRFAVLGLAGGDQVDNALSGGFSGGAVGNNTAVTSTTALARGGTNDAGIRTITNSGANPLAARNNYTIGTLNSGTFTINRRALSVSLTGSVRKTYDGNDTATLGPGNYTLGNFAAGEGAGSNISRASGTYADKNAAEGKNVSVTLQAGDFALQNANPANYTLPTGVLTRAIGAIDKKVIQITGVAASDKTYDGSTATSFDASGATVATGIANESFTVVVAANAAAAFDTADVLSATVGSPELAKPVSFTGFSLAQNQSNALLSNYTLLQPQTSAVIVRAQLTAVINDAGRPYGAADPQLTFKVQGLQGADTVATALTGGGFTGGNVGDDVDVTSSSALKRDIGGNATTYAITNSGANPLLARNNYALSVLDGTFTISKVQLALSLTGSITKVYDGNPNVTLTNGNFRFDGFVGDEGVNVGDITVAFDNSNAGSPRGVSVPIVSLTLTPRGTTDLGNYILPTGSLSGTGSISKRPLDLLNASVAARAYDTTRTAAVTGTLDTAAIIGSDDVRIDTLSGQFATANAGDNIAVTVTGTLAGTAGSNYLLRLPANLTGNITKAVLTYAVIASSSIYGTAGTVGTATLSGVLGSDQVSGTVRATTDGTAGTAFDLAANTDRVMGGLNGYRTIVAGLTGGAANNYQLATQGNTPGLHTINAKAITAAIGNSSSIYGNTPTLGTVMFTGALPGDLANLAAAINVTGPSPSTSALTLTSSSPAGAYTTSVLNLTGARAFNYVLAPTGNGTGTHTIDRRPLTYSIANSTSIYGTVGTVGAATLSNIVPGDDVAAIVRPMRAGAPGGPFDLAANTDRVVGGLGGYRTTVTGLTGAASSNYEVAGSGNTDGRHEITARPVTFAIANSSSIYGDTPTPGAVTLAGILPGDAANVAWTVGVTGPSPAATATTLSATSSAGDYTRAVLNLTGTRAFNYAVDAANSTPGTHTVDRRLLTVTLTGTVTKAYDGFTDVNNLTTANFQLGNFAAGEGAGSTVTRRSGFYTGTADVGTGKEVRVSLGDADFQLSNASASNYNLPSTNVLGNIGAITQRTLTATLVGAISRTYDGTRTATVASSNFALSGFARGQGATVNRSVAEFDTRDAGAGKTVTVRDLVAADFTPTGATNLANYVLPTTLSAAIGRIVEKELTVSGVTAASRPYDGTATATLTGGAISQATGLVAGDAVTLATTTAGTFATRNAGEAIRVTPTGFSISGADARNYNLIQPTPTANITRREIVVTGVTADSKTYDGTIAATLRGGTLSGVLSGDSVTIAGGVGTFADRNVGAGIGVTAAALTLSGPDGGNYAVALPTGLTADIRARTLTASLTGAISKTYDGTTAATLGSANVTLSGFAAGESATLTRTTAVFDTADAGTRKTVTITGLTAADFTAASGTRLGNYVLPTAASGTGGTIVAAPLTVTPANLTRVYGAADPALTFTATGFVAGETAALLTGGLTRAAGDDAGSYAIGQGTLAAGGNYEIRLTPGTFTITPAALTVAVADATRVYGDANPAFTLTVTGFVAPRSGAAVDTAAVLTGAPVASTEATGTSAVGSYAIAASGGAAANYRFAYRPGTLQITPAQLTVTANPVSKAYGAADPALTFAAAGLKNAETAATVLTGALVRAPGTGVGSYAIGQGSLASNANYALSYVPAAFVITPAQLSYAIANTRATYGSVASVGPVTFTGLVAGETVTPTIQVRNAQNQTVTLAAGTPAGAYTAAVTAIGGAAAANYTLATTGNSNGLLTIDRANLGVAVGLGQLPPAGAALARPVGAPNPAVVYALTGLVAGDTADAISALLSPSGLPADLGAVGSFRIGVSQTALANYTLAVTPATLTVTAPQSAAPLPVQSPVTTGGAIGGLTPAASATPLVGGGPSAGTPTVFALTTGGATAGGTGSSGTIANGATASDTSGGGTAGGGPAAGSGGPASADSGAGAAVSTLSSGTGYSVNLLQVADTGAGSGSAGADTPTSGTGDSPLFQSDSFNTGDDESQPGAETN